MKARTVLVAAGLSISAAGVVLAGPVNAGFELAMGPVAGPGPLPPFTNGWALQSDGPLSTGRVSSFTSLNGLGTLTPQEGGSFAVLQVRPSSGVSTTFLTSAPFTVGAGGAVMTFEHFFDGAAGAAVIFGTATELNGNASPVNFIPSTFPSPFGWTTSAPVALGAGDWALSLIIGGSRSTGQSTFGLDKFSVVDNNPIIPLPSGVAMAAVGLGLVGVRRRRG